MLDRDIVKNGVKMLLINFSIDKTNEGLKEYTDFITGYLRMENITNEEFNFALTKFIKNTSGSNFNRLPSVGDYMQMLNMGDTSIEEKARVQLHIVKSLLKNKKLLKDYKYIILDDKFTHYTLNNEFGEFKYIEMDDYFDNKFLKGYVAARKSGINEEKKLDNYISGYSTLGVKGWYESEKDTLNYGFNVIEDENIDNLKPSIGKKEEVKAIMLKDVKQLGNK
ncbi:MAG: hypothetical protein Unbinned6284contig1004_32 [Prokaryotic dsDNA virus sp.]|nr:MAG: hypothetical protein Unbinned6284contig1004_32 [Prokaryotic dsDNA virus sp.]|tara:strand:- start:1211 stop:1879 length:669 start_codon:yes stop_codon:yes gene_type:complete